jgi:imidazolonepropionase-like amidohydrolase
LNQEAAKAKSKGTRAGMNIPPEKAIGWITSNAAKSLGIDERTGSLEAGKMADVVIWNGNPFSVYAKADHVYIDGALIPMESRQTKLRDRYLPQNPEMPRAYIKP